MKKSTIVILIVVVFVVVVGSAVWLSLNNPSNTTTGGSTPSGDSSETQTPSNATDSTNETEVQIAIRDMSYSPVNIRIKKGTTVTWTNNDTVGHNVVADSPSSSGGLPSDHSLLGKGETFSHTFDTVGTFAYHCTPHPFMKGTVEVVE